MLVFGGIPNEIQTYDLALGTALFDTRFNGFIRNVKALNCSHSYLTRLDVVANSNVRFIGEVDACSNNPCKNGGACSLMDAPHYAPFKCDCSYTTHEGALCERPRPAAADNVPELTFTGKDYFFFEMPTGSSFSMTYEEEFHMSFRTSRSTGLLAYAGDVDDYLVFGLQDGGLFFKLNIKGQAFERTLPVAASGAYLHDERWHTVKFARKVRQIDIVIDEVKRDASNLTGEFIAMQTRVIYVGGAPQQSTIYRTIRKNFIGCLRNVTFKTDQVALNLIELALNNSSFIHKVGNIQKGLCFFYF